MANVAFVDEIVTDIEMSSLRRSSRIAEKEMTRKPIQTHTDANAANMSMELDKGKKLK
jgi:hypothetical protein